MLGDAALPGGRQTRPGSSQRSGQRRAPKKRRPRGRDIKPATFRPCWTRWRYWQAAGV